MRFSADRLWLRLIAALTALIVMWAAAGCSSNDDEELIQKQESVVTDPVSFEVTGISGDMLSNVEQTLNAIPPISKKRVFVFNREIRDSVRQTLRAFGYYHSDIKLTLPDRDNEEDRVVRVEITAGKPLFIRYCTVQILGEGARYQIFHQLVADSGLASYTRLSHAAYESLKTALQDTAFSMGFFDAKLLSSYILVHQAQNMADVELIFDTGRRYVFGEIRPQDEATERLLLPVEGLMTLDEGRQYSAAALNDYIASLNQTNYYRSVDIVPNFADASNFEVPLDVRLERKADNLMRVGVGYSTDEGPRLLFEWDKPLLNDYGHSLSTKAELTMLTQDAQVVYKMPRRDPNLDYYYINAAQTHTDFNDTLSDRSHLSFHYVADRTGRWRRDYSLRAEYEDYTQGSDEGYSWNFMPALVLSRRESSGGFDPKRGYSISMEVLGATAAWSDLTFIRFLGTFRGVISPTPNTRLVTRLQYGATGGPDALNVPPSLRFFAGGDQSIRGYGYMDESVRNSGGLNGARYLTTGTVEFQFPMGIANSRLAVFMDAGAAVNDYDQLKDELLLGPGFGYRYVSSYGIVRVDLGFGIDKDPTDIRLHFAFGPEF